jgi:hypothetical protein
MVSVADTVVAQKMIEKFFHLQVYTPPFIHTTTDREREREREGDRERNEVHSFVFPSSDVFTATHTSIY